MRALKVITIVTVSMLLVMLLMVGYLFTTAEVVVTDISAQGIPAVNAGDTFHTLTSTVDDGTFIGTLYQKPTEWKDASEYVYMTYTLSITNNCLVPIDMIEVQIVPQSQDILQLSQSQVYSLPQRTSGQIPAMILSTANSHPVREMIVTYYVWGFSFTMRTTYGK